MWNGWLNSECNSVLSRWCSRKVRDLWWQGIPPSVRGRVWSLAIGNELNITHGEQLPWAQPVFPPPLGEGGAACGLAEGTAEGLRLQVRPEGCGWWGCFQASSVGEVGESPSIYFSAPLWCPRPVCSPVCVSVCAGFSVFTGALDWITAPWAKQLPNNPMSGASVQPQPCGVWCELCLCHGISCCGSLGVSLCWVPRDSCCVVHQVHPMVCTTPRSCSCPPSPEELRLLPDSEVGARLVLL